MPEPTVGKIKFPQSTQPVENHYHTKSLPIDLRVPVLGVMSALVCMGILFGTRRTLNTAFAHECAQFARELYDKCVSMSS